MPVEVLENTIRVRVKEPDDFQEDSFRVIDIDKAQGIQATIGRLKGETVTSIQSYIFDKDKWTAETAEAWVKEHETKALGPDAISNMVRGAFNATMNAGAGDRSISGPDDMWGRYDGVLSEHVIVENGGSLLAYPYTFNGNHSVMFGEPRAVHVAFVDEGGEMVKSENHFAVKALREENGGVVVGGIMCINGDPAHKDLQGEYFTPETDTMHQVYKSVPTLFHHGLDPAIGLEVIGHRVKAEKVGEGLWVEDWLDKSSAYWEMVEPLLDAGVLHYSPGSAPHLVRKANDGRLLSYPVVEDTLTVTPAQHRTRPVVQIKAAYEAAGLELPPELTGENGRGDAGASRRIEQALARAKATVTRIRSMEV